MKRTNVLFVVPPTLPIDELNKLVLDDPSRQGVILAMPMGLLSIASYAGKHTKADFKILDFNIEVFNYRDKFKNIGWANFCKKTLSESTNGKEPEILGISAILNCNAGYLQSIASNATELWSHVLVVVGGGVPTNMYSYVLGLTPDIDAVAIGEGEIPFLGLLQAEDRKSYLEKANGWMTRTRVGLGSSPAMDLLYNLDEIPFLRYDLLDFGQYQKVNRYHGEKQPNIVSASIMTSRGCPHLCNFCASHTVHGRKIRYHSPERVLEDIRLLKKKYGVKILIIEDDNLLVNKKRALKILKGISCEDLIIEVSNGLSIMSIDEEIVDALKVAGLKMAGLGVESGSERVLNDIIHKPYTKLSEVKEVVSLLRRKEIYIRGFLVIGFPEETKEDIFESVRFMKQTGFNWVAVMIATPIAGSELYDFCKKNNLLISNKIENFHYGKCNIKLPHSTPKELEELSYLINLEVNFVENYDLKNGHPETALIGFRDVINRMPDHAFAYYYASQCYQKMGKYDLALDFLKKYFSIVDSSKYWAEYARHFNLPTEKNF